jgi:predicted Zn-dependent protease
MPWVFNKKFLTVITFIIILQPVYIYGQGTANYQNMDSLFSGLDTAFDGEPSPEEEYYIGRAVAANILAVYKPYTANTELINYLNLICYVLAIYSNYQNVYNGYHVIILDSRELNAFSTPGGHIFITKGLIDIAPCEDALAGIIAHELAHVMLKHGLKMIDGFKIVWEMDAMAGQVAAFSGNEDSRAVSFRNSVSGIFDVMIKSGFSQPQEFEADNLAVKLLADAGYSPDALSEMLKIIQNNQQNQSTGIFTSHPATNERIANIEGQIFMYRAPDTRRFREERFTKIMDRFTP